MNFCFSLPLPSQSTGAAATAKKSGPTIIIFVVGGISYSEMRAAYEASAATNREVIVGKSSLIMQNQHVRPGN